MFILITPYVLVPLLVQGSPGAQIFVSPASIVDTNKKSGSTFTVNINVSDIPSPGLFAYEFYMKWNPTFLSQPKKPIANANFTDTSSTKWNTTTSGTVTGTPSWGYDSSDGNPNMTTYFLSSSSVTGFGTDYRALSTTSGAEDVTTTIKNGNLTGDFFFDPFTANSTATGTPNATALKGYGWRSNGLYNKVIPTGTWTFYITLTPTYIGTGHMEIWVYKCNSTGTGLLNLFSIDATGTNVLANPAKTTYTFTYPGAQYDLTGKALVIEYWLHVTGATASAATQTKLSTVSSASSVLIPNTSQTPSYYLRANATSIATASITFYTEQRFNFTFGKVPNDAYLAYAYRITGNSIPASGSVLYIRLVKPDTSLTQLKSIGITGNTTWVYVPLTATSSSAFALNGTYTLRLMSVLKTAASGTDKYIQANWDDVQLKLNPLNVAEGPFLKNGGSTYFTSKFFESGYNYIYVSNSLTGTPYSTAFPQTGGGRIANVTFFVEGYNETALDLYNTVLLTIGPPPSYPPVTIDHTSVDGYFANIAGIVHDVAVIGIAVSPHTALDGQLVSINATVKNNGTKTETFTVSTYYDSNLIQTKNVTSLSGGTNTTLNYSWNTAGIAPGTYTIKAVASTIPGETNTANNAKTDGTVTVTYTHNVAVISVTPSKTSIYLNETITITVVAKNLGTATETFTVTAYYATTSIGTKPVTALAAGANQTLLYTWNTTNVTEGSYPIKAIASTVTGEIYTADNTYVDGSVQISARHDVAVLSVSASPTSVLQGQNITIAAVVKNLGQKPETFDVATSYDSTETGPSQTVSNLAVGANKTLTFIWNTTSVAPKTYTIKASALLGTDINQTNNDKIDGAVTVIVHDVAVFTVTPANTTIYVKMNVTITVGIGNQGGPYAENFTVTLYYNTTIIATQTVTNLAAGTNTTLTIYWSTSSVPLGKYQIKAVASTVPNETNTANNAKIDGMVTVKVTDANGDGAVDITDLALLGKAWQSTSGQPNYNTAVDFNNDGIINVADFALLGQNWGYGRWWST